MLGEPIQETEASQVQLRQTHRWLVERLTTLWTRYATPPGTRRVSLGGTTWPLLTVSIASCNALRKAVAYVSQSDADEGLSGMGSHATSPSTTLGKDGRLQLHELSSESYSPVQRLRFDDISEEGEEHARHPTASSRIRVQTNDAVVVDLLHRFASAALSERHVRKVSATAFAVLSRIARLRSLPLLELVRDEERRRHEAEHAAMKGCRGLKLDATREMLHLETMALQLTSQASQATSPSVMSEVRDVAAASDDGGTTPSMSSVETDAHCAVQRQQIELREDTQRHNVMSEEAACCRWWARQFRTWHEYTQLILSLFNEEVCQRRQIMETWHTHAMHHGDDRPLLYAYFVVRRAVEHAEAAERTARGLV